MTELLLAVGLAVAVFVGFNIGGSSTGVAFGPAVGSNVVSKFTAAGLMSVFALLGGATVGTRVIDTMGGEIVPREQFTLVASVIVLFFVGAALLLSNLFGVPASMSMTAVGAIAGLGLATGTLSDAVRGERPEMSVGSLAADGESEAGEVEPIGEEEKPGLTARDLFDPAATARVVVLWIATPSISASAAFLVFRFLPVV